jgi:hypothetical protein
MDPRIKTLKSLIGAVSKSTKAECLNQKSKALWVNEVREVKRALFLVLNRDPTEEEIREVLDI